MTTIGVISDTHVYGPDQRLEQIVEKHLSDVDCFIHAGDLVRYAALDCLYATGKEVYAVAGNMDVSDIDNVFPDKRIITIEDVRIGITHGWGAPGDLRIRIRQLFANIQADVQAIVYGHTHQGFAGWEDGMYFFNPGSPLDSRYASKQSVGILTLDAGSISGELITV